MTTTETKTESTATSPADATWDGAFEKLKARYPKVREPIVMALHILMHDPKIASDDAKAQAKLHGVRITAASLSAAQRLLSRQDDGDGAEAPKARKAPAAAKTGRQRRPRAAGKDVDAEALIKQVVVKIQDAGNAEADRLREAMRKAISVMQAAVEA